MTILQAMDAELASRLRGALQVEESLVHRFIRAAGDLSVNLVVALVILVATFWVAGWAARLVRRLIARVGPAGPPDVTLQSFAGSLARYAVIVMGLVAVLQQLGVQATSILAVLGAASLAVGLALQGALGNVAAGVMLLLFRPYRVGDLVEIGGRVGTVRALDLFVTELATPDNVKIILPNGKVFGDVIVNMSFHDRRRVDAVFRVPYRADAPALLEALRRRAEENPLVLKEPAPSVELTATSDAFIEGVVHAWVERADFAAVKGDLILAARILAEGDAQALPQPPAPRPTAAGAEHAAPAAKPRRRIRLPKP